jgi:hypothetical protein
MMRKIKAGNPPRNSISKVITITTDFGVKDPYVGIVKGVILTINPSVRIVDICHDIDPGDIRLAAFFLDVSRRYFPPGTVHLAVVDPGVGGPRKGLIVESRGTYFVGPDNGTFSYVCRGDANSALFEIITARVPSPGTVSHTFHGRDIFAPVAAALSLGRDPSDIGRSVEEMVCLPGEELEVTERRIEGTVEWIDRFGNVVTNIDGRLLTPDDEIGWKDGLVKGVSRYYTEVQRGKALALIGSSGYLEISVSGGDASTTLRLSRGDDIFVHRRTSSGHGGRKDEPNDEI